MSGTVTPVVLPSLGEDVTEATVVTWLKRVGEIVEVDEPLLEVSTDKVDTEIPSPVAGVVVEILVEEDAAVPVGTRLAVIEVASTPEPAMPAAPASSAAEPTRARVLEPASPPPTSAAPSAHVVTAPVATSAAAPSGRTTQKLSRLRKLIASRMVESLQISAQLTTVVEVDVSLVAKARAAANPEIVARGDVKLSYLPFFARAAIEALQEYPTVNSSIDLAEGTVTFPGAEHLGIAVDTERGLFVPVIREAGRMSIREIARAIDDAATRTRDGSITADELTGGTFTLSNTGSRGALFDTPIINQPQVAILATGAVVPRSVVITNERGDHATAIRPMAYFSLTYDHRIVDGADAARFLTHVKQNLEQGGFDLE